MTQFINASVNESATIVRPAKEDIETLFHRIVGLNDDGTVSYPTAGGVGFGVGLSNQDGVKAGESVHIAMWGVVPVTAGVAIKPGQEVAVGADGQAKVASAGEFIFGIAVEGAAANGRAYVQITKSGYKS